MPETRNFIFDHTELAEILIKRLDIHEGLWGVYIEFGLLAANVPAGAESKTFFPAAINFVKKIGILRFDEPSNLTVDAAKVNPPVGRKKVKVRGRQGGPTES